MCKKIGILALAVVAGLFILKSTHLGAYARTAFKKAQASLKQEVPLEFQLESIRNEAAHFMPEMRKQISALAAEDVSVSSLRNEVATLKGNVEKQKEQVRLSRTELASADMKTDFDRRSNKIARLRDKLERQVTTLRRSTEELKAREELLEARERGLDAAKEQVASMKAQKEQWDVQIAQMEAEIKSLRLAQTKSNFQLDDSKFARIKGMIEDVRKQIQTQQVEAKMWEAFAGEGVASEKKSKSDAQLIKEAEELTNDEYKAQR
jgi:chromosome segregation ATPase